MKFKRREFILGALGSAGSLLSIQSTSVVADEPHWDMETDVLVAGTGVAGCTAAIAAADSGAKVTLLEKAGAFGGTSAKSGGAYWIPNNFDMRARGLVDHKPDFLRFAARYSYPELYRADSSTFGLPARLYDLLEAFYDNGSRVVDRLANSGALRSCGYLVPKANEFFNDYLEHVPENRAPVGRLLKPQTSSGEPGAGDELMGQLRTALGTRHVHLLLRHRIIDVVSDASNMIIGAVIETPYGVKTVRVNKGIVFGTGGYAHSRKYLQDFQARPIVAGCAAPTNTGDFLTIASRLGAALGNMSGAWRAQVVLEDALRYPSVPNDVWTPPGDSMVLVNYQGRRIVNEKRNYHDRTKALYAFDPNEGMYPNLITFMIYDERVARMHAGSYPLPEPPDREAYVIKGESLAALVKQLDQRLRQLGDRAFNTRLVPDFGLQLGKTIARFNEFADSGHDTDFGRGAFQYDQVLARAAPGRADVGFAPNQSNNPTLYPITTSGPFYAIILAPGILDTNGGPIIDAKARVLNNKGEPLPGLYGAGNCIACPAGDSYWGAGATIGQALTFGYIAGENAAMRDST